jgi:hypothetical protein
METGSGPEHRLETRNNMFVIAALYVGAGSITAVRIRNLSQTGALIEAGALPAVGTPVRLTRGSLSAGGEVMWVEGCKAGLRFETPTCVADWLPQGKRGSGQQLADEAAHLARLGATAVIRSTAPKPANGPSELADNLALLQQQLERAGEQLAEDGAVAARHMLALQMIDGAAQQLARLVADARATEAISLRAGP